MTADDFRRVALVCSEAAESGHMGKADFRVGNKIFATLGPAPSEGVLKLTPRQQEMMTTVLPQAAVAVPGAWGARGWTRLHLDNLAVQDLEPWMLRAWGNVAPKRLAKAYLTTEGDPT